ncbi:hypothetical protein FOL47_006321 [Perkinsus chesapeaki]|uniref:Uncharacterized protein n=1 Tax=Perkinsus chesapeaki TaxID=330153 RepID=A0A7J6LSN8_PERCH|nr:hypothetical protein FOL47_006321 [Perkinsus chesapeaki]
MSGEAAEVMIDKIKATVVDVVGHLLRLLNTLMRLLAEAVKVSAPVVRRLLFLSYKMFSSIMSKLKNAVSSKDQQVEGNKEGGEHAEVCKLSHFVSCMLRPQAKDSSPAEGSKTAADPVLAETPVKGETDKAGAVETPAKEVSDRRGKRHSSTPLTAPKGDSEPPTSPKKDASGEKAEGEGKKKKGGKKKKAAEEGKEENAAAPKAKAAPKKKAGKTEGKTDAELDKENETLAKDVEKATQKYRDQQAEIAKARRDKKDVISVAANLYQIAMGIEPKPRQARTDSFSIPQALMGDQTKRGAETARTAGSASRFSRQGSGAQGKPSFFPNSSGSQFARQNSNRIAGGGEKEADLNKLIKEAKAHQALLRKQSQAKLEGVDGGKPNPEEVRSRLRTGNTKSELEKAIKDAKELDMSYEAKLAEKKLNELKD